MSQQHFPATRLAPQITGLYVTRYDKALDGPMAGSILYTIQLYPFAGETQSQLGSAADSLSVPTNSNHSTAKPANDDVSALADAESADASKSRAPSSLQDVLLYKVQRRYEDFVMLHSALQSYLTAQASAANRTSATLGLGLGLGLGGASGAAASAAAVRLPTLPRWRIFTSNAVCEERVLGLDKYVKELFLLPSIVTSAPIVSQFFGIWPTDVDPIALDPAAAADSIATRKRAVQVLALRLKSPQSQQQHVDPVDEFGSVKRSISTDSTQVSDEARPTNTLDPHARLSVKTSAEQLAEEARLDEDWLRPIEKRRSRIALASRRADLYSVALSSPRPPSRNSFESGDSDELHHPPATQSLAAADIATATGAGYDDSTEAESERPVSADSRDEPKPTFEEFVATLARKLGVNTALRESAATIKDVPETPLSAASNNATTTGWHNNDHIHDAPTVNTTSSLPRIASPAATLESLSPPSSRRALLDEAAARPPRGDSPAPAAATAALAIPSRGESNGWTSASPPSSSYKPAASATLPRKFENNSAPDLKQSSPVARSGFESRRPLVTGTRRQAQLEEQKSDELITSKPLPPVRNEESLNSLKETLTLLRTRKQTSLDNIKQLSNEQTTKTPDVTAAAGLTPIVAATPATPAIPAKPTAPAALALAGSIKRQPSQKKQVQIDENVVHVPPVPAVPPVFTASAAQAAPVAAEPSGGLLSTLVRKMSRKRGKGSDASPAILSSSAAAAESEPPVPELPSNGSVAPWNRVPDQPSSGGLFGTLVRRPSRRKPGSAPDESVIPEQSVAPPPVPDESEKPTDDVPRVGASILDDIERDLAMRSTGAAAVTLPAAIIPSVTGARAMTLPRKITMQHVDAPLLAQTSNTLKDDTDRYATLRDDAKETRRVSNTMKDSPKLFRNHTLSSGTAQSEVKRHFVPIRAISGTASIVLKISRTVDFATILDKLALRFASHEASQPEWKRYPSHFGKQIVAIQNVTYKDSDSHLIHIQDEEDWILCLDEAISRGKLTLYVTIESNPNS